MEYINLSNISIVSLGFFFNFILFWNTASSFWLWMVVGMFESIKFQKSTLQKVAKFLKFLDFFRYFFCCWKISVLDSWWNVWRYDLSNNETCVGMFFFPKKIKFSSIWFYHLAKLKSVFLFPNVWHISCVSFL